MVDTMENKRTRTFITEEIYNKAKPIVDLFAGQQDKYKTKTDFYESCAKFVAEYTKYGISKSTAERMMKSTDWENYKEISKKANPHTAVKKPCMEEQDIYVETPQLVVKESDAYKDAKAVLTFLDDFTTAINDIRTSVATMANELSCIRKVNEALLNEWRGNTNNENIGGETL